MLLTASTFDNAKNRKATASEQKYTLLIIFHKRKKNK